MGYNGKIPKVLVDKIYDKYSSIVSAHRGETWTERFALKNGFGADLPKTINFIVEKDGEKVYRCQVSGKNTMYISVDNLSGLKPEQVKSIIAHELTHFTQEDKVFNGERNKAEYGYGEAVANDLIDETIYKTYMWLIENLQEREIEALLSELYFHIIESDDYVKSKQNITEQVETVVKENEEITLLNSMGEAINFVQGFVNGCDNDLDDYQATLSFIHGSQMVQYGEIKFAPRNVNETKRLANKILSIYAKRYERYRKRVYNAVYQALMNKETNSQHIYKENREMKQTIRLTERQFHNMVKECVKSFINERDANGNMLYTFYVETLENDKGAGHYQKSSRLARNSNDALQQIVGDFDKKGLSVHGVEFANQKEPSVNEGRIYNPIEKVQSLIDAANNAYAEASKHTQDKWCLMDREGNSYGLENPIALKRGYVIINYDDPYHAYADNQIRVLTRQNGKDVLFNGDYYDEGWKDAKRELNRIIKDAERGKQYFEQYNPNWEDAESKEDLNANKSAMRGFNKSIGLKADTGMDSINKRF